MATHSSFHSNISHKHSLFSLQPGAHKYSPCISNTIIPLIQEFKTVQQAHGRPSDGLDNLQKAFEIVDQTDPGLSESLVAEIIRRLGGAFLNANELANASSHVTGCV